MHACMQVVLTDLARVLPLLQENVDVNGLGATNRRVHQQAVFTSSTPGRLRHQCCATKEHAACFLGHCRPATCLSPAFAQMYTVYLLELVFALGQARSAAVSCSSTISCLLGTILITGRDLRLRKLYASRRTQPGQGSCQVAAFEWGAESYLDKAAALACPPFDIVVAADCCYVDQVAFIPDTCRCLLLCNCACHGMHSTTPQHAFQIRDTYGVVLA
jgi:hypothetical protein